MDEYSLEMDELKTLVTSALEKKGVLAKIRAELRASVFEAIEEQDRAVGSPGSMAVLGGCNDEARQLHSTATGKLLAALVCEYLEWCELEHTLKVYLPEVNLPDQNLRRSELESELGIARSSGLSEREAPKRPLLAEVLDSFLRSKREGADGAIPPRAKSAQAAPTGGVRAAFDMWHRRAETLSEDGGSDSARPSHRGSASSSPRVIELAEGGAMGSTPTSTSAAAAAASRLVRMTDGAEPSPGKESGSDDDPIAKTTSLLENLPPLSRSGNGSMLRAGGLAPLVPLRGQIGGIGASRGTGGGALESLDPEQPQSFGAGGKDADESSSPRERTEPRRAGGADSWSAGRPRQLEIPDAKSSQNELTPKSLTGLSEEDSYDFDRDIEEVIEEEDIDIDDGVDLDYGGSADSYLHSPNDDGSQSARGRGFKGIPPRPMLSVSGLSTSDHSGDLPSDGSTDMLEHQ